ncbi:MAG: hypothetical protein IKZ55_07580, partial [Bacteroidales bacterium]|nr:hypothetical protein [Bacteroidales bacterium]
MTNIYKNLMPATAAKILPNSQWGGVNACKSSVYKTLNSLKTRTKRAKTLLMLLLLGLMITPNAFAQSTFGGGSGSETNPYIISTTEHLDQLAADVNGGTPYTGMYFRLTADLDYEGKTFTPIGRYLNGFQGYFNGFHHSINNVTVVSEGDCIGIFGFLNGDAQVRNLTLGGNSRMEGYGSVGGIVGYMRCHANLTDCSVSYCRVGADVIIAAHDKPNSDIADFGGIVGTAEGNFTIRNCTSRATLTNSSIARCTGMGGIVGTTVIEGTIQNCISLSPINCGNDVGGIIGRVFSGTPVVVDNLYTNFHGGGIQGADTDDAAHMGRISFGDGFATTLVVDAAYTDGSTNYGKDGSTVTLQLAGNIPGYATFNYFANGTALTPNDGGQYTFTMPVHTDVTVTLVADKRDIGYSDWVSISIPPQIYTGSSLTPVVTVTDNMSGTPIVLVENTDYTVTLPDGGCVAPGNYTITITGIGDFGGQTTAVFAILNPGSGTEDDPFVILNTEQMDALAASVNGGDTKNGLYFRLEADLDYSGKTYTPVGTWANRFQGHFDGIGHSISNVVINQPSQSYLGLFGCVGTGGTVTNLVLGSGSAITGNANVGGIVGYTDAGVTLSGCSVNEGVTVIGDGNVGGIAGCFQGNMNWCVNKATVSGSGSGSVRVGGIAGLCYQATLTDNMNLGAVSGSDYVGGICGVNAGSSTLSNNYYAGNCTAGGINGGDVAGQAMRGWVVSATDGIFVQQMPDEDYNFTGITYDGIIYLGAGQTGYFIVGRIDGSAGNFAPSAGTLTAVSSEVFTENYYALAMPTEGQDVVVSSTDISLAVPGYGESTNAGWRFIASPVAGSIEAEAVGNIFLWDYDLYRFNQSETLEWRNHDIEQFELENGQGYLYASETDITLLFGGTYNTAETHDVPLVYDANASFAGWNLVGNPFPVEAYANKSYYTMNADGTGIEPVAVSSAMAIPACTGVMVKAD